MDKNAIKKYAVWARRELIERVSQRAYAYGITAEAQADAGAVLVNGQALNAAEQKQHRALIEQIQKKGYEQVMEEVAYTWFNRFVALRFMEVNGYLPSHIRVFTDDDGTFRPQILTEAIHLDLDGLDMEKVYALERENKKEELFKYLLIVQCNALSSILPGMFQKIEDYTEFLLPDYLLREGSVIEQMVTEIAEEDWTDQVQIIGWLYQYYNTEPKDQVFADLKKNIKITKEKIPAATQLFTPDWIVHYMVENSLGRLWTERKQTLGDLASPIRGGACEAGGGVSPEKQFADSMGWKYYLEEAPQEPEVEAQLKEIRKEYAALKPEEILCIDPCMGSGHILCVLFDVLVRIYEDYGYTAREAAVSIVQNNLWGLDIDDRAAQLAYFAVMMKARQYDRRFFSRHIQPHVYAIAESNHVSADTVKYFCNGNAKLECAMQTIITELHDAKEYGSILTTTPQDWDALYARFDEIRDEISIYKNAALALEPLVQTAQALGQKYHVTVTNPPYMGSSGMDDLLLSFLKGEYPNSKSDTFSVFIERCVNFTCDNRMISMITQPSWLFLGSFEKMRKNVISKTQIQSLLHMGRGIFGIDFGSVAFTLKKSSNAAYIGKYFRLHKRNFQYINPNDIRNIFLSAAKDSSFKYDFTIYQNNGDEHVKILESSLTQQSQQIYYEASQKRYASIDSSPVAYWCPDSLFDSFNDRLVGEIFDVKSGLSTGDNDIYLRNWYEISAVDFKYFTPDGKWVPYNKGGGFRKWFGVIITVVKWGNNGEEIRKNGKAVFRNPSYYFKEGLTWTGITSGIATFRYCPEGYIFDSNKGPMIFGDDLMLLLGFLNSNVANMIIKMLNPTVSIQIGDVIAIPYKDLPLQEKATVSGLVENNIKISYQDWNEQEISWGFKRNPLIRLGNSSLLDSWKAYTEILENRFKEMKINEESINEIYIKQYELDSYLNKYVSDEEITLALPNIELAIRNLISYIVGCMFGRYSLDEEGLVYAGGEWDASKYKTFPADKDAIIPICDDEYFTDDIVGLFVKFIETVYGAETLEENLRFIADALGTKGGTSREVIRNYFLNDFYKDHLKTYQKRPIYWLFDSGKKNGFKCLIYMHRYQPDTIARIRTDYVHGQQSRYRTAIADLEQRVDNASASERVKLNKQLQKLTGQSEEVRIYEEKIHHLADQFIPIDLDDGVKVNYAKFQDVLAKIK